MIAAEIIIDGRPVRFGPDEDAVGDILVAPEFSTQIPGGFHTGSFTVNRPGWIGSSEEPLLSRVRIYDTEVGYTLYEGIVRGKPQVTADAISVQTEGLVASLDYDVPFSEIYVDRDLGRWSGPSRARRLALYSAFDVIQDHQQVPDGTTGSPGINLTQNGRWGSRAVCEAVYDAGSACLVGSSFYEYTARSLGSSYTGQMEVWDDDVGTNAVAGTDVVVGASSSGTQTENWSSKKRYLSVRVFSAVGASTADVDRELRATGISVRGNHTLTLYTTAEGDQGVLGSDVIRDVLARKCPLITVDPANVEVSSYVIPHLIFVGEESARSVIETVTLRGGAASVPNDWGVYDDGFFWRQPGTYGRTWQVRRDQYVETTKEGPDASERFNAAFIFYTDGGGVQKSVGPPGSGADTETDDLYDDDPDNPVNRAGIPRKTIVRSVGITDADGATLIGRLLLAEASRSNRKGSVSVTGTATTEEGNTYPAAMIRAGDQIVVEDDPDPEPLPVNSTSYRDDSMQLQANVGAVPDSLEVLLSQLDSALTNF